MAKNKELTVGDDNLIEQSNFKNIDKFDGELHNIKNEDHSDAAFAHLREEEEARIKTFVIGVVKAAMSTMSKARQKVKEINKPDNERFFRNENVAGQKLSFTGDGGYSEARATQLSKLTESYNELIVAYDAALTKGSEQNWKAVETLTNKVKSAL